MSELNYFHGHLEERKKMTDYFVKQYGRGKSMNVLKFYHDFYRDVKRKELNHKSTDDSKSTEDSPKNQLQSIKEIHQQKKAWENALVKNLKIETSGEVHIALNDVKAASEILSNKNKKSEKSFGCFIQFFESSATEKSEKKLKAYLQSSFSGYGKMMSRFLHTLDPEMTTLIKKRNQKLCPQNAIFLENCDASYFNANLHPALMEYEIWAPGSNNNLPNDKQLAITEFDICHAIDKNDLVLLHRPTQKVAYVMDLGFQASSGRSQLFQLLEKFTHAQYVSAGIILSTINTSDTFSTKTGSQIKVLPRVIFEKDIVLQRKMWVVPKETIPTKLATDSDWEYFKKINLWAINNKIPGEVFVTLTQRTSIPNAVSSKEKLTRDDYKPQYINFNNPLLVRLFHKMVVKAADRLHFSEMLPTSEEMLRIDGNRHVTEFVVEWQS